MPKLILFLLLSLCPLVLGASRNSSIVTNPPSRNVIALETQEVLNGASFVASGQTIHLWGIEPPKIDEEQYLAAKLYLEVILKEAPFSCYYKHKDKFQNLVMQCISEKLGEKKLDIASLLVRMGMARDSDGNYKAEETFAKENQYGIWK